jgi:hypothetical protein
MATVIVDVLDRLNLEFPKPDRARLREIRRIRKALPAG